MSVCLPLVGMHVSSHERFSFIPSIVLSCAGVYTFVFSWDSLPKMSDQTLHVLEQALGASELQMTSLWAGPAPQFTTEEGEPHPTCPLPNGTTCLTGPAPSS